MDASFKNIAKRLTDELNSSQDKLLIAIAWFTNEIIFDILITLLEKGISIELILINDHINNRVNGLDFNKFIKKGGKLYFAQSKNLMHNKFVIIDNQKVLTGSYNWTYNAEFRNNENIVILSDKSIIQKFEAEFSDLALSSLKQEDKISAPLESFKELNYKEYIKDDLISKSDLANKQGDYKKSMEAITQAIEIDQSDSELKQKLEDIKVKQKLEYHYHVEDGQFSFDFKRDELLGKEGEIIGVPEPYSDVRKIYILYIDELHVECVGNIERTFPKDSLEHQELKESMIKAYQMFE